MAPLRAIVIEYVRYAIKKLIFDGGIFGCDR
jgi:hypothetical protein